MAFTRHKPAFDDRRPVFVKFPSGLNLGGTFYKKNAEVPWQDKGMDPDRIKVMYYEDMLYHNADLEKEGQVGDRLEEFDMEMLKRLYASLNNVIKAKTTSQKEYNDKKIKWSVVEIKLRAFIRTWLYRNPWAQDEFEANRDRILKSKSVKIETPEEVAQE